MDQFARSLDCYTWSRVIHFAQQSMFGQRVKQNPVLCSWIICGQLYHDWVRSRRRNGGSLGVHPNKGPIFQCLIPACTLFTRWTISCQPLVVHALYRLTPVVSLHRSLQDLHRLHCTRGSGNSMSFRPLSNQHAKCIMQFTKWHFSGGLLYIVKFLGSDKEVPVSGEGLSRIMTL